MFENDYFMRMIHDLARALAKVLFNKDSVMYELPQEMEYTAADDLYCRIQALLSQSKINEAFQGKHIMIGLWCNGSTTGFGSVCPSSNLGSPTIFNLK